MFPFEEFRSERQAAGDVKRVKPILVVIGNPPYNGFTGVGDELEGDLVAPYKEGLSAAPWEITKNKLDDYYVRFFRVAERRIAEVTDRGVISFVSNFGWLGDPSAVLMRRHLLNAFDQIYIDNLNGDSRETGKKTPEGKPDPSIFSSKLSPSGIQVGAAISLLVRTNGSQKSPTKYCSLPRQTGSGCGGGGRGRAMSYGLRCRTSHIPILS
jgi:predicted helicase